MKEEKQKKIQEIYDVLRAVYSKGFEFSVTHSVTIYDDFLFYSYANKKDRIEARNKLLQEMNTQS